MKGAAVIYLLSALALLGLDARAVFLSGVHLGTFVFAVVAAALLVLARSLFLLRPQARRPAIVLSTFVALAFGALAVWIVVMFLPGFLKFGMPEAFWWLVGVHAAISLAYGFALLFMLLPNRARALTIRSSGPL